MQRFALGGGGKVDLAGPGLRRAFGLCFGAALGRTLRFGTFVFVRRVVVFVVLDEQLAQIEQGLGLAGEVDEDHVLVELDDLSEDHVAHVERRSLTLLFGLAGRLAALLGRRGNGR